MSSKNRGDVTLPDGYCLTTIGEVVEGRVSQDGPTKDFTYLDIGSVDRDSKTFVELKTVTLNEAPSRARQVVQPSDVLVSMTRPNLNAVAMVTDLPGEAIASTGFHVLRSPWVEPKLLFYLVQTEEFIQAMTAMVQGALYPAVRPKDISSYQFGLPPRDEQPRIVEKLEELLSDLDSGVAELKAAQRKLAQYRQSLLKAAVEGALTADWRAAHGQPKETGAELLQRILSERRARWEQKQLAKFTEQGKKPPKDWQAKYSEPAVPGVASLPPLPNGWTWASVEQITSDEPYALAIGPFGSNLVVSDYRDEGVPLVFVRNIRSKSYGGSATKFVTQQKATELKAHLITAGDVLVTKMGEPPGDADVYPDGQPTAVITADCIKVRPANGLIDPYYLAAVINSPWGIEQIKPMTQGVAQKKVSLGRFSGFIVPLPPKAEQDVVVALLAKSFASIEEQDVAADLSLKQAAAQRKNLLKAAFAGQLVLQDPNEEPASTLLERIRRERPAQPKTKSTRKMTKSSSEIQDGANRIRAWIESRDLFTFDELKKHVPAPYQVLKDSLFNLLAENPPIIEQEFASDPGIVRFRRIRK